MRQYVVRYMTAEAPGHTQTDRNGPWDYSGNARAARDTLFKDGAPDITHCWVERVHGGPGGRTINRYGAVLKREILP